MTFEYLLSAPMIRRCEPTQICLQLLTSSSHSVAILLNGATHFDQNHTQIRLGEHLFINYYVLTPYDDKRFEVDSEISYQLLLKGESLDLSRYFLQDQHALSFVVPQQLTNVLHGSCRNPHHHAPDALVVASDDLAAKRAANQQRPSLLILSGDQIYADDVAGPMLKAIGKLINTLGIYREPCLIDALATINDETLYKRAAHLPMTPWHKRSKFELGYWLRQNCAHFSSMKAANHLVHIEEFIALYLLTYSHYCWQLVALETINFESSDPDLVSKFAGEKAQLIQFVSGLPKVEALLANISTITMFDDHDVTDDWNLTAQWEQNIYSTPVSKRVISNGLLSYLLFQGVGNQGSLCSPKLIHASKQTIESGFIDLGELDNQLLGYDQWHYQLATQPKVVVLDTRTHRWRAESDFNEPSGLLDWESLCELEQQLAGEQQVLLVSPAPVFGVKAIEVIQATFNLCGQPLLVDVENWMAHEGAARKLLSIFRREDTPTETIILSGDVHYSFCFSVKERFNAGENRIWQLTASGIKNEFPQSILSKLEWLDNLLYGAYSPLNFFTKRWQMKVKKHRNKSNHRFLNDTSAISLVELSNNKLVSYQLLHGNGERSFFDLTKAE